MLCVTVPPEQFVKIGDDVAVAARLGPDGKIVLTLSAPRDKKISRVTDQGENDRLSRGGKPGGSAWGGAG